MGDGEKELDFFAEVEEDTQSGVGLGEEKYADGEEN